MFVEWGFGICWSGLHVLGEGGGFLVLAGEGGGGWCMYVCMYYLCE